MYLWHSDILYVCFNLSIIKFSLLFFIIYYNIYEIKDNVEFFLIFLDWKGIFNT